MKIETQRLTLTSFSIKDISERYISWLNDPSIVQYSENRHRVHSYDSCLEYFNHFNFSQNIWLSIRDKKNGFHIGNINAYCNRNNNTADIGILIGEKSYQGKGLGLEAWFSLICYLFEKREIRKVTAGTMSENQSMIRVFEKCHMGADGIRKNHYIFEGKPVDLVHVSFFQEKFKQAIEDEFLKKIHSALTYA